MEIKDNSSVEETTLLKTHLHKAKRIEKFNMKQLQEKKRCCQKLESELWP